MKIALDCDDVLVDANASLAVFHNERYGTSYTRDDVKHWHLEHIWNCSREEACRRVDEWLESHHHASMNAMPGAIEAVGLLSLNHELPVVTARSELRALETSALLDRHFGGKLAGIHFTNGFAKNRRSKGDVCLELGATLIIEDSSEHAYDNASKGMTVLLMDSPWNQGVKNTSKIVRVFGWRGALDFIG